MKIKLNYVQMKIINHYIQFCKELDCQYTKGQIKKLKKNGVLQFHNLKIGIINKLRKTDTDDLLKKCFEFDWANNKIAKFIKNDSDRDKIK